MYPYSICIINVERKYLLPSVPTRGHGLILLVFWTLIFISENLAFLNLGQKEWWFQLKSTYTKRIMFKDISNKINSSLTDQIEMGLFVLRYISCLMVFVLGLKAPGIMQNVDYFNLNDSTRNYTPPVSINQISDIHFILILAFDIWWISSEICGNNAFTPERKGVCFGKAPEQSQNRLFEY